MNKRERPISCNDCGEKFSGKIVYIKKQCVVKGECPGCGDEKELKNIG